jgi:predicted transposase/invertase (TIGR01784 family)
MAEKKMELIRFDWALKRILRDKATFVVLEGFLSVLLKEKITIEAILSSQSNQEAEDEKYNDVDTLIRNSKEEHIIIEVQNTKQIDYFHRILFGASKIITEYLKLGTAYENVKKVISVTVAYFDLGQGLDYVYHGTSSFKGIHRGDILNLSTAQRKRYGKRTVAEVYPEYWIIKAGIFDEEQVNDDLDQWIYFFKTGSVLEGFDAAGLDAARELLDKLKLEPEDREAYSRYEARLSQLASFQLTEMQEVQDLIKIAEDKKEAEKELEKELMIIAMSVSGISAEQIAIISIKTKEEVTKIIEKHCK